MRFRSFALGAALGVAVTLGVVNIYALVRARQMWLMQQNAMQRALAPELRRLPTPWFPKSLTPADESWTLQSLDGKPLRLSDLKGRVVFLDFWATWCEPCLAEMPSIERLHDSLSSQQIAFLMVTDEDPQKVRGFLAAHPLNLPIYTRDRKLPEIFPSTGVPVTYVVDRSGRVVLQQRGRVDWDTNDARRFLSELAGEPRGDAYGGHPSAQR